MIVVRTVFRLKFGKMKEAKALMKDMNEANKKNGLTDFRLLTDVTGPSYTFVFESNHKSLSDFEQNLSKTMSSAEWQTQYAKFVPLVDSSYREIFTVV
jgi:hypothetical protein